MNWRPEHLFIGRDHENVVALNGNPIRLRNYASGWEITYWRGEHHTETLGTDLDAISACALLNQIGAGFKKRT